MTTSEFHVDGIVCEGCAMSVKQAVFKTPGVVDVQVDVPGHTVTVRHDEAVDPHLIQSALRRAGFSSS